MKPRYATLLPLLLCTGFALAETPRLLPPLRQNVTIPKGTPMRYQGTLKDATNFAVLVGRMRLEGWLYADLSQDDGQAVWSITFKPTPAARAKLPYIADDYNDAEIEIMLRPPHRNYFTPADVRSMLPAAWLQGNPRKIRRPAAIEISRLEMGVECDHRNYNAVVNKIGTRPRSGKMPDNGEGC